MGRPWGIRVSVEKINFWKNFESLGRAAGAKFPELVAAQAALETGFGKSLSGANNYFGLKGKGSLHNTQEEVNGIMVPVRDSFLNFNSAKEAAEYLVSRWYKDFKSFKGVNRFADREAAARGLLHEGYASDSKYPKLLIELMNQYAPRAKAAAGIPALITPEKFQDIFEHFEGLPHQVSSVWMLYADLEKNCPHVLQENSGWLAKFRSAPPKPATPITSVLEIPGGKVLSPWFHFGQSDNGPEGWRQCQTSSIAMALRFMNVKGIKDDLDYLKIVNKYGDTTVQETHHRALAELGVKARFELHMTNEMGMAEIDKGFPFVPGFLHHGPVSKPIGGGHYCAVYGYENKKWIPSDPFGELDLVNGGWLKKGITAGANLRYSFENFGKRWRYYDGTRAAWIFS